MGFPYSSIWMIILGSSISLGVGTNLLLPPTTTSGLETYFQTLYSKLYRKEYGFASHGQPCDVTSSAEMVDHLDAARKIIRGLNVLIAALSSHSFSPTSYAEQDPDGKIHPRPILPHLHFKLRSFFQRSKTYCDFRKFLKCTKQGGSRTCQCARSFMSPSGDLPSSSCAVEIGKRCIFSDSELEQLGFPIIANEPIDVSCISPSNSECVPSFGAAKKICKCKRGYGGDKCKASEELMKESENGLEGQLRRGLGVGFADVGNFTDSRCFLYPEGVQEALLREMERREMYASHEERTAKAQLLYSSMEWDRDREGMVVSEICLRKLAILLHGEKCDPNKQIIVDNPPREGEDLNWMDPKPEVIHKWYKYLLEDGKPLCSFERYLMCDGETGKCRCKDEHDYQNGKCVLRIGQPCGFDYNGTYQFDILKNRKRFSPQVSPPCGAGSECTEKPLFFMKRCWCEEGKSCENKVFKTPPPNFQDDFKSRLSLQLGDDCKPRLHWKLLNPKLSEIMNHNQRLSELESILGKSPPLAFCSLEKYLNCSAISKKCECFEPLEEEEGSCRVPNRGSCNETFSQGLDFYPGGVKMWRIEKVFQVEFHPVCIQEAECNNEEKQCVCRDGGNNGPLCQDPNSRLGSALRSQNVDGYEVEGHINEVFFSLVNATHRLEKLMRLGFDQGCDPDAGVMLGRIMNFFIEIGSSDKNVAGSKTLYQYKKAANWLKFLLRSGVKELCNGTIGLNCNASTKKCSCSPTTSVYEDGKCYIKEGEVCDPDPQTDWIPTCKAKYTCTGITFGFGSRFVCQCKVEGGCADDEEEDESDGDADGVMSSSSSCKDCSTSGKNHTSSLDTIGHDGNVALALAPVSAGLEPKGFQEMKRMLDEIMRDRALPVNSKCSVPLDQYFHELFPTLPNFGTKDFSSLPHGAKLSGRELKKIYSKNYSICDKKKLLTCKGDLCTCDSACSTRHAQEYCGSSDQATTAVGRRIHATLCKILKWTKNLKT